MAERRKWARTSALLTIVGGAALLFLVLDDPSPLAQSEPVAAESEPAVPEPPPEQKLDDSPVTLAAVTLPPPPMLETPTPAPKPEPEPVNVKAPELPAPAPEPVKPESVAVRSIKPLQADAVPERPVPDREPETDPVHLIKPLKAEVPQAKPSEEKITPKEPVAQPEPEVRITPLQPSEPERRPEPKAEPEVADTEPVRPLRPMPPRAEVARAPDPEPKAVPEPREKTLELSVDTTGNVAREGRALLRLLEYGSGPTIEIGWPRDNGERQRLYRTLVGCFGMKPILMDGAGNLYAEDGPRGQKWEINLDRFSGFVRQPAGFVAADERNAGEAIRRYHGLRFGTAIVRIFPRRVDAVLLGGLQQILGDAYGRARAIHGTYRQIGDTLFVEDIVADGVPAAGRIAFPNRRRCGA